MFYANDGKAWCFDSNSLIFPPGSSGILRIGTPPKKDVELPPTIKTTAPTYDETPKSQLGAQEKITNNVNAAKDYLENLSKDPTSGVKSRLLSVFPKEGGEEHYSIYEIQGDKRRIAISFKIKIDPKDSTKTVLADDQCYFSSHFGHNAKFKEFTGGEDAFKNDEKLQTCSLEVKKLLQTPEQRVAKNNSTINEPTTTEISPYRRNKEKISPQVGSRDQINPLPQEEKIDLSMLNQEKLLQAKELLAKLPGAVEIKNKAGIVQFKLKLHKDGPAAFFALSVDKDPFEENPKMHALFSPIEMRTSYFDPTGDIGGFSLEKTQKESSMFDPNVDRMITTLGPNYQKVAEQLLKIANAISLEELNQSLKGSASATAEEAVKTNNKK